MREELEDQLQVKEATLMEHLENQRQSLLKEKVEIEEKLQRELESALEKDKKLAEELALQKQNLEKVRDLPLFDVWNELVAITGKRRLRENQNTTW